MGDATTIPAVRYLVSDLRKQRGHLQKKVHSALDTLEKSRIVDDMQHTFDRPLPPLRGVQKRSFAYGISPVAALRILTGTEYYKFGVLPIVTMNITHLIGSMSWYFRNAMYSNGVMIMSILSIVIAFIAFGFSLIRESRPARD